MFDLFEWVDLIAPIGIVVCAVILCSLGAFKAKRTIAKVICITTALVFVAGIPFMYLMRYEARRFDYTLNYGLKIRDGNYGQCPKEKLQKWIDECLKFWKQHYTTMCIEQGLRDVLVMCKDRPLFNLPFTDKLFLGYSRLQYAVVGYEEGNEKLLKHVFIHEVSHNILYGCVGGTLNGLHHKIFVDVNFPYR